MNDGAPWDGNRDQPRRGLIVCRQGAAGEREEEDEEKRK
jgi:hypothetical protein